MLHILGVPDYKCSRILGVPYYSCSRILGVPYYNYSRIYGFLTIIIVQCTGSLL